MNKVSVMIMAPMFIQTTISDLLLARTYNVCILLSVWKLFSKYLTLRLTAGVETLKCVHYGLKTFRFYQDFIKSPLTKKQFPEFTTTIEKLFKTQKQWT